MSDEEWDRFLDKIASGYNLAGSPHNGYGNGVYTYKDKDIKAKNKTHMEAHMYNGAIAKMRWVGENDGSPGIYEKKGGAKGDIIFAQYFRDLEDYFNQNFISTYCDNCNSCEGCNSCNVCESGQCTQTSWCCSCEGCEWNNKD